MTSTDAAKAVLVLTTRLGGATRPSLTALQWHALHRGLRDAGLRVESVFDRTLDWQRLPIDDELLVRVRRLVGDAPAVAVDLERLTSRGMWALTALDDGYPERLRSLGRHAPPVIFGAGDPSLMDRRSLGIVGSRDVPPEGAVVARAVAEGAATRDITVVSGAARGVDRLAMDAAFDAGGSVVGVLADSLERRIRSADVLAALDGGIVCLITQQHPAAGFSPAAAMARNKLVYALSDLTVVVAADVERGGTWAGATEALSHGYGPVAVWRGDGGGPGNEALQQRGATPSSDVEALWPLLDEPNPAPPTQLAIDIA